MMTVLYVFLTSDFQRLSVLLLLAYLQSDKKSKTLINKNVSVYLLKGFLCYIFVPEMRFPLCQQTQQQLLSTNYFVPSLINFFFNKQHCEQVLSHLK